MLSLHLRFHFIFLSSSVHYVPALILTDISPRDRCYSGWHYLAEEALCVIFAESQGGDVQWSDGHKACRLASSRLLTLSNRATFLSLQKKANELLHQDPKRAQIYANYLQRGAWIGKAKRSRDDKCESLPANDLEKSCDVLTIRPNNGSLCIKRASCIEKRPFICQNIAVTNREFLESTMERISWKCIINVIWCIVDSVTKKKNDAKAAEEAAAAQELANYTGQFQFGLPENMILGADGLPAYKPGTTVPPPTGFELMDWLLIIGSGFITLLTLCICCTICICLYKKMASKNRNPNARNLHSQDGSLDSAMSAESR